MDRSEHEGHGDHWHTLEREQDMVADRWLRRSVEQGKLLETGRPSGPLAEGEAVGIQWSETPLRILSLIAGMPNDDGELGNVLASAYPCADKGIKHRLVIEEVWPWENGIEGWVKAIFPNDAGPSLTFFDTHYYANRHRYQVGAEADFVLAAVAYHAEVAHPEPVFIEKLETIRAMRAGTEREGDDSPIEVRLEGAAILFPTEKFAPDDCEFQVPVKEIETFTLGELDVTRLSVTVLRLDQLDDEDINIDLYVPDHCWGSEERPAVGSDIKGLLWLQGYLAP